jgi:hypothetical protein
MVKYIYLKIFMYISPINSIKEHQSHSIALCQRIPPASLVCLLLPTGISSSLCAYA